MIGLNYKNKTLLRFIVSLGNIMMEILNNL